MLNSEEFRHHESITIRALLGLHMTILNSLHVLPIRVRTNPHEDT